MFPHDILASGAAMCHYHSCSTKHRLAEAGTALADDGSMFHEAKHFERFTLFVSAACLATAIIDSGETVRKNPAM